MTPLFQLVISIASGLVVAITLAVGARALHYLRRMLDANQIHARRVELALDAVERHLKVNGSEHLLPPEYTQGQPLRDLVIQIAIALSAHIALADEDRSKLEEHLRRYVADHPVEPAKPRTIN